MEDVCVGLRGAALEEAEKMGDNNSVLVDYVTRTPEGAYCLILVEEGPWVDEEIERELERVRMRLCNGFDALLLGLVANKFPESEGQAAIIKLSCFNLPNERVMEAYNRFVDSIDSSDELQCEIESSAFVATVEFTISLYSTDNPCNVHADADEF